MKSPQWAAIGLCAAILALPVIAVAAEPSKVVGPGCAITPEANNRAVAAFQRMLTVLRHPRCANCHGEIDVFGPEAETTHGHKDKKGKQVGGLQDREEGLEGDGSFMTCQACHTGGWTLVKKAHAPGMPDRDGTWKQFPPESPPAWARFSDEAICKRIKDSPKVPAGAFINHLRDDVLVTLGFEGRRGHEKLTPEPPPMTQGAFIAMAQEWMSAMKAGAEWPGSADCGCIERPTLEAGLSEAGFQRRLAGEDASFRRQFDALSKLRQSKLADFAAQESNVFSRLTQLEAASRIRSNQDLAGKADAAVTALRGAPDTCALVPQAKQKLTNTLARMTEHEDGLERILADGRRAVARCTDPAAANEAERKYKEAAALQHLIDQQAATLPLLAVQMGELETKLTSYRQQRASALQLLAAVGAQRDGPTTGALDATSLQTAWNELRRFDKDWAQAEAEKLGSRLADFRAENANLVSASTLNAGVGKLRTTIDSVIALAIADEELRRFQARVQALQSRALKLPSVASGKPAGTLQALRAAVDDAACAEAPLPSVAAGLETAETTRSAAQRAMDKLGGSLQAEIEACRTKLATIPPTEDKAARVAAAKCAYPGSEAYWDEQGKRPMCRCHDGKRWNADRSACVIDKEALVAKANCSRYLNTEPRWNDAKEKVTCACIGGYRANAERNGCLPNKDVLIAAKDCSRHRNAEAYWSEERGEARCRCIAGTRVDQITGDCAYERVASRPTPPAVAPPRQQDRDEMFSIIASALSTTDENYRKYPECRYRRAVVLSDAVRNIRGGKGEIEASASALRNRGHASVELRYLNETEAPRWVDQWRDAEKRGYDACWNATRAASKAPSSTTAKSSATACFEKGKRVYPCNP